MFQFNGFTEESNNVLNSAIELAQKLGHDYIGSEHILAGIASNESGVASEILNDNGITVDKIVSLIEQTIGTSQVMSHLSPADLTPRSKHILEIAIQAARTMSSGFVGPEHILLSIIKEGQSYGARFLVELGGNPQKIVNEMFDYEPNEDNDIESFENNSAQHTNHKKKSSEAIDKYGRNLTQEAKDGKIDPVIGRQKEIERVIQILTRRTKNNPCLIGEPGVGKTAVAEGLADKIAKGEVPELLKNKKVVSLDLTGMIAGAKYRGEFEERIKKALDAVKNDGDIILFIDELHTIVGAGASEGSIDAANILKPSLARGEFQVIGATTISEYRKYIEKDSALERRFQPVMVGEPSEEEAIEILFGLRDKYEAHHKVKITDEAIYAAVNLSSRYISDRFLPDKAIDLVDEAASKVKLRAYTEPVDVKELEDELNKLAVEKTAAINSQNFEKAAEIRDKEKELSDKLANLKEEWSQQHSHIKDEVTPQEIAEIVSGWTGIPATTLTEEEGQKLINMEKVLHERLVGQEEAVSSVSRAIRRGRVGLKDPKRPIGSFLFLGPTGVGKTELCKTLAETLFGDENSIIRFDMSEYMEKHSVSKLVGSPPGYVGYEEGGQLTEKVRRKPYCVILFDEIEKSHPDVFNILLQIMDDGVLTDSQGRRVNFKNTIVIMTSNVGATRIGEQKSALGFGTSVTSERSIEEIKSEVMEELKNQFRPEFLNRIDDIVVFHQLNKENIIEISKRMLKNIASRIKDSMDINVEFSNDAINLISEKGYDPVYGARPLRRVIQNLIEDSLSEQILEKKVNAGDKVLCDVEEENFIFKVQ